MDAQNKPVSLRKIARWLNVPWSTVHYNPQRTQVPKIDHRLASRIYELVQQPNYSTYGYRRVTHQLQKDGLNVNKKKVQRIMRMNGWTLSRRAKGFRPRVNISSSKSSRINERWTTDMTHFFVKDTGWCHLVAVMDCWNREIIGYRISKRQNTNVAEGALEDALIRRYGNSRLLAKGLILRSDNGLIFTSKRFMKLVNKYKIDPEYITPYTPEQNGMIECFMRTLKQECKWMHQFKNFTSAKQIIEAWIGFYNNDRLHSALNYQSPAKFKNQLAA